MKIVVVILLLMVIISLFSGLYFVMKDKGNSKRAVKALTWRVAFSMGVFLFLMAGYYFGWIPHTR
ncbi:MAG: twin transmembrane helix small protein [Burkholderiales bacterium]